MNHLIVATSSGLVSLALCYALYKSPPRKRWTNIGLWLLCMALMANAAKAVTHLY